MKLIATSILPWQTSLHSDKKQYVKLWFPGDASGKEPACQRRRPKRCGFDPGSGRSPGGGHDNPYHCSCLGNPWTEELSGLQPMGLQRVGHNWSNLALKQAYSLHRIVHQSQKVEATQCHFTDKRMKKVYPAIYITDSVHSASCLTVHTMCTDRWNQGRQGTELRGWKETWGAAGTADTFILS